MTTDDLRTRAREAAWGRYSGPQWHVGTIRERQVEAYVEGYLAHAAQQPTREQIAEVLCVQWFAPSWEQATRGQQDQCLRVADRVLALLDGTGS